MKGSIMAAIRAARKVHVLGIAGQEGRAVFDYLLGKGLSPIGHENALESEFRARFLNYSDAYSENEAEDMIGRFLSSGAEIRFAGEYLSGIEEGDVVIAPQAYRRYPANAPMIMMADEGKISLFQAIEIAFDISPCFTIGVTGTAGKSTTVSLIGKMISASGKKMYFSGNDRENKWDLSELENVGSSGMALFEVSHRHLMDLQASPDVAVIVNIYPHHLDDAGSFEDYIEIKKNLIRYQSVKGKAIVAWPLISREMVVPEDTSADLLAFGGPEGLSASYVKDGNVFIDGDEEKEIVSLSELPFAGEHNVLNALAACAAASAAGISVNEIRKGLLAWTPLKYRLETIYTDGSTVIVNDGKSSDPLATMEAVRSVPDISVLVMGGVREGMKSGDFVPLAEEILKNEVENVVIFGKSRDAIIADLNSVLSGTGVNVVAAEGHDNAFKKAFDAHVSGALVFSPACQSFDEFKDYRERGEAWNKAVAERYGL
jgi:UDP-N-acetylmuramoylalanine--D-glutamate ligase